MTAAEAPLTRSDRGGFRSFPVVMSVFVGLLVAGIALGFVIHARYVAFERVVARHVPGDVPLVVRWEVEKITLFEPTRRYLLPLLDATPDAKPDPASAPDEAPAASGATRRKRLAKECGLDAGRDLREALALVGPAEGDWALVLGGAFPKAGVTDALERVLRAEGRDAKRLGADALVTSGGMAFGRASDGVLVLASSRERLEAATAVRQLNEAIPRTGAGSLVFRADAPGLSPDVRTFLAELGDVSRIEAVADWGTPLPVDVTVHYRGTPPPDALDRGRRVVAELMGPGAVPPTELMGDSSSGRTISFRILLNDEALARAARRTGDSVYGTLWRKGQKTGLP